MKSLLKRSSQPAFAPNWHPNFRNTETLPDIKAVRTTFFINAACITVALIAVAATGFREYRAFSLRRDIALAEQRIADNKEQNEKYLALNHDFNQSVRRTEEAIEFVSTPIIATRLLGALSKSQPANMEFTEVNYDGTQLILRGSIRGASDTSSERVEEYLDVLRKDPEIGPKFPEISLSNMIKDPRTQGLTFDISLKQTAPVDQKKRKPAPRI